ncbi:thiamine pyrophosphate-binding protein [Mesorhizobium sp. BR1-1-9]|uniref:thiamine pyrophosphate-binding protein n=1 Tax=Mesorhizobium sp. BR1-1-9 TaxID=2876646 RepID=UPI001CD0A661|nr:thiamine pyrophosphate-binding protein [Mesorhizobium sp. BR1-1-9]MBZ9870427.1 thiamine pyrophosphate-binding protein [Mesorhizobium sp. BR1-1-9]
MTIKGYRLFGEAVAAEGVDTGFFIMGGPSNDAINSCIAQGIRMIDVRHEQAAAMMANAYARVRSKPAFCIAASGPGTINLTTGLAHALVDCAPVVAFGGAAPVGQYARGAFQEIDQLEIMKPVTKFAERVYDARRIPEYVARAFRMARSGKPGPVYLDLPGDVLYADVEEQGIFRPAPQLETLRPGADAAGIEKLAKMIREAKRPVLVTGSGVLWSKASEALHRFVDMSGIPFYTTPQGRGVIPEDHPFFFAQARSQAFREADLVIVVATRLNYVISYAEPPRFSADAKLVRIDIDPVEIDSSLRLDLGIVADARTALDQLSATIGGNIAASYAEWRATLAATEKAKLPKHEASLATDQMPIHPLRLCKEIRDFIDRDTILCVDGQEILNYGRQSIPSFMPGHRLNSGPFGTMGVGLPFGVGAKAASPDSKVLVLHGDGSFGLNAMEIDTAVRHKLPLLIVISLNGGWTADPDQKKPGRNLGYTRFDLMGEAFGCHGEFVEKPDDIRPALERAAQAVEGGQTAIVNVVTDWRARSGTANFTNYST